MLLEAPVSSAPTSSRALNARGYRDIHVVDALGAEDKWRNLLGLDYIDYWDKGDFRKAVRDGSFERVDAVFHLGACSSTTERDAGYLADNNYQYSRELCEWSLRQGSRFIYASSAATYGDGSLGYSDDHEGIRNLRPLNMYGYSKHMFDLWALRQGLLDRIVGLKYFNVYGPGEAHKGAMRSLVNKAFQQIRDEGRLCLFKSYNPSYRDGGQLRDFVYVRDAVDMTLFPYENPKIAGLFNCGSGTARTWNDLAEAIFDAMERRSVVEYIDMPEELRAKYQYHTEADMAKLRGVGYDKRFASIEDGVLDYLRNYR